MVRSELVKKIVVERPYLSSKSVEAAVDTIFDAIVNALVCGRRVEIRGFGIFFANSRDARIGRNPRTGRPIFISAKRVPRFKASGALFERLNH